MKIMRLTIRFLPLLVFVPLSLSVANSAEKIRENAQQISQDRLFHLGVALLQYSDDYDGKLPPIKDAKTACAALGGYALAADFLQPGTTKLWQPNPALSGAKHADLSSNTVAFYATTTAKNGLRDALLLPPFDPSLVHYENNSGFVKNYIKSLSKKEWRQIKPEKTINSPS